MSDRSVECLVVGAGPAGLGAAIQAARFGVDVLVVDENSRPGGQLFKQIHKFFGSKEHLAGTRGFVIGERLLEEARDLRVEVMLDTLAWGLFRDNIVGIRRGGASDAVKASQIVIAAGAVENTLAFPGSTKPGVITAGAAQTMCNIHRVLPGRKVLMAGTGNVGLIVAYQLMQAGARIAGIIDAAAEVGGYDVHANKLRRAGIPFYLNHTLVEADGGDGVESAVIAEIDGNNKPLAGTEKTVAVDTVALAVGLSPRIDLLLSDGNCRTDYHTCFGGHVPLHNDKMEVRPGLIAAGDVSGIEEASTALEEGRLAGTAAAERLGRITGQELEKEYGAIRGRLKSLRSGRFGEKCHASKESIIRACEGGYAF